MVGLLQVYVEPIEYILVFQCNLIALLLQFKQDIIVRNVKVAVVEW